jgi:flagellar hook-length control protein FliK
MNFLLGNAIPSAKANAGAQGASEADPNAKVQEAGKDFSSVLANTSQSKTNSKGPGTEELLALLSNSQAQGKVDADSDALLLSTLLGDAKAAGSEIADTSSVQTLPEGVELEKYALLNGGIQDQSKEKAQSLATMSLIAASKNQGQIESSKTDNLQTRVAEVRGILNRHKNAGKVAGDSELKYLIEKSLKPVSNPATGTSKVPLYSLTITSLVSDLKNRGVSQEALGEIRQKLGGARVVMENASGKSSATQISTEQFLKMQQMTQPNSKANADVQNIRDLNNQISEITPQGSEQASEYAALGTLKSYEPSTITIDAPLKDSGEVDQAALEQKVFKTIGKQSFFLINDNGGQLKIKLNPNNLGEINLMVRADSDKVDVSLVAENAGIRDFIKGKIDDLRMALGNQELRLVNVNVEAGSDSASGKGDQQGKDESSREFSGSFSDHDSQDDGLNQWSKRQHRDLNADPFGGPGVLADPTRNYQNVSASIGKAA